MAGWQSSPGAEEALTSLALWHLHCSTALQHLYAHWNKKLPHRAFAGRCEAALFRMLFSSLQDNIWAIRAVRINRLTN